MTHGELFVILSKIILILAAIFTFLAFSSPSKIVVTGLLTLAGSEPFSELVLIDEQNEAKRYTIDSRIKKEMWYYLVGKRITVSGILKKETIERLDGSFFYEKETILRPKVISVD